MLKNKLRIFVLIMHFLKSSIIYVIITSFSNLEDLHNLTKKMELGLIITLFYTFSFFSSIFCSIIYEKCKLQHFLIVAATIWILGSGMAIIHNSFIFLCISVSILGLSHEILTIFETNIISKIINPKKVGKRFSIFIILQGGGGLFGIFITGFLVGNMNINWMIIFSTISLFVLCLIIIIWFIINQLDINFNNKQSSISKNLEKIEKKLQISTKKEKISKNLFTKAMKNKINIYLILIFLFYFPIHQFTNIWIQMYWQEIHNLDQTTASISLIFTSGGEFFGIIISGIIIDKYSNKEKHLKKFSMIIITMLLSGPFLIVGYSLNWTINVNQTTNMNYIQICWFLFIQATSNPNIFISYISLFVGFLFAQFIGPMFYEIGINYNEKEVQPLLLNLGIIFYSFGRLVGPILGGYLGDIYNLRIVLLIVPYIHILAGIVFIKIRTIIKKSYRKS